MPIWWSGIRKKEKTISAANQQSAIDYNVFEGKHAEGVAAPHPDARQVAIDDGEVWTEEGHGHSSGAGARRGRR